MNNVQVIPEAPPSTLKALGLTAEDLPAVRELHGAIDTSSLAAVSGFGLEIGRHTSTYTDEILSQVRSSDLDKAGALLSDLAVAASSANLTAMRGNVASEGDRSKVPVIGPLLDGLRNGQRHALAGLKGVPVLGSLIERANIGKKRVVARFSTVEAQVNQLAKEVDATTTTLNARISRLTAMAEAVRDEYRLIGRHILAGVQKLGELNESINAMPAPADPQEALEQQEARAVADVLDKRVADLRVLQHSTLQQLPMIRALQDNDARLVEKFASAQTVTIPAFKRQFVLAIALEDQRKSVDFAEQIDDTNNALLTQNADLLYRNTTRAAKANQRLAIDVETLKSVQESLAKTYREVEEIQAEGARNRRRVENDIVNLQADMKARIAHRNEVQSQIAADKRGVNA